MSITVKVTMETSYTYEDDVVKDMFTDEGRVSEEDIIEDVRDTLFEDTSWIWDNAKFEVVRS